jgi:hypothetical protein
MGSMGLGCSLLTLEASTTLNVFSATWTAGLREVRSLRGEEKESVVKKNLKSWARCHDGGGGRRTVFHTRDLQLAL